MAAKKKSNGKGELRIRMYRVGFGDFFLMTVPSAAGPQHILIDCGVTGGTTKKGDIGTIKDAVADMAEETGNKLALIIVTHRHQDHIVGFSRSAEISRSSTETSTRCGCRRGRTSTTRVKRRRNRSPRASRRS